VLSDMAIREGDHTLAKTTIEEGIPPGGENDQLKRSFKLTAVLYKAGAIKEFHKSQTLK
jgi:hypothetical protein